MASVEKKVEEKGDAMLQSRNLCLMNTLKGQSGSTLDLDFKVNAKCLATSPDGLSAQCAAAEGDRQEVTTPSIVSTNPQCVISLKSACRPMLSADQLYCQLLKYRLTPEELYLCSYPRPVHKEPGCAVWRNGEAGYSSLKTCCRCGDTFVITPGGEYHSNSACLFHTGRRSGSVFSCCSASVEHPGCEVSNYHVCAEGKPREKNTPARGFVCTRPGVVGGVFALDCEMCFTIHGLEVTKVTVVGWNGAIVYESYVKPESPVLDYITAFSGVTAEHLENVQITLKDVQAVLLSLFAASTVLVGHGLENDLRALKLLHDTVVDTAMVFPHHKGLPYRRSLRSLVNQYLNRDVQAGPGGHDSAEDARACMELVLWKAACDLKQHEGTSGEAE